MSITYNLETLSDKQKSDLELAQTLLDNLNPLRPSHKAENHLSYNGCSFSITQLGYSHKFLVDDINLAIQNDYQKHKKFISETIQKEFEDYDLGVGNYDNLKLFSNMFVKYYKKYPLYSDNEDFKDFIEGLCQNIEKELLKS